MESTIVHVATTDATLHRALRSRLSRAEGFSVSDFGRASGALTMGDIVITTVSECPVDHCAEMAAKGLAIIILAAIPRQSEADQYRAAGAAAYVAMTVDSEDLMSAVRIAAERKQTLIPVPPVSLVSETPAPP
jgi:DNA-binding NarL/FixJ family response regulator